MGDKANRYGECCEVLKLALERQPTGAVGLMCETMMNMRTGDARAKITVRFRRAKKGDTGTYGHGKPYATSTFAPVEFCPFCGAKDCTPPPPTPKDNQP